MTTQQVIDVFQALGILFLSIASFFNTQAIRRMQERGL